MGHPQHGCVREHPPQLDDGPSPSRGQMNDQQDDANDEEDPCDLRRDGRHTRGTKDTRNQPDDEKNQCVIKHFYTSLSPVIKHTVCRFFPERKQRSAGYIASPRVAVQCSTQWHEGG